PSPFIVWRRRLKIARNSTLNPIWMSGERGLKHSCCIRYSAYGPLNPTQYSSHPESQSGLNVCQVPGERRKTEPGLIDTAPVCLVSNVSRPSAINSSWYSSSTLPFLQSKK